MSSAPTPEQIAADATWLVQALDPAAGVARLIAMDREAYRAASFLDDRLLQQPLDAQLMTWRQVEEAAAGIPGRDARWIFHIGHVGSTLVSRLLGEIDGVLSIREPRLLRDLALSPADVRQGYIAPVPKLVSRTFAQGEIACVKATSFASEIAPQLVPEGERALFLYATPSNYIASILAGENSVQELRMLAPSRRSRLQGRVPDVRPPDDDAQLAAQAWACEMTALEASADSMPGRDIAWADFDRMLTDMAPELARIAEFFGFAADDAQLRTIAEGPLVRRYSKALEYDYSADLRRELIRDARARHQQAIDGALAMLRSAADKSPLLARALSRAED